MSEAFTIVHISDLHFHRLPRKPTAYLNKRALGALNLLVNRRHDFPLERAEALVERLAGMDWSHLLITGDLTQLSLDEEFALARHTLAPLLGRGPGQVTVVPGNHDRYVRDPRQPAGFETHFGEFSANGAAVLTRRLTDDWWLVAWDSAIPAPWFSAVGRVPAETLTATERFLAGLPRGARVMLANHYPLFFPRPYRYVPTHDLLNHRRVKRWVQSQPIDLYLHGHIHRNWVMEVPGGRGRLTVVNSASSTERVKKPGRSAFHTIELNGPHFRVEAHQFGA